MPRAHDMNQQLRETQRTKILAAASKVFAQQGLSATIGDVAEAAGVSYGLVYHYFARKEALYHALVAQALASADVAFEHLGQMSGTPGQRLDALVSRL